MRQVIVGEVQGVQTLQVKDAIGKDLQLITLLAIRGSFALTLERKITPLRFKQVLKG